MEQRFSIAREMPAAGCDDTAVKKRTREQGTCGGSGAGFRKKKLFSRRTGRRRKEGVRNYAKKVGDTVVL